MTCRDFSHLIYGIWIFGYTVSRRNCKYVRFLLKYKKVTLSLKTKNVCPGEKLFGWGYLVLNKYCNKWQLMEHIRQWHTFTKWHFTKFILYTGYISASLQSSSGENRKIINNKWSVHTYRWNKNQNCIKWVHKTYNALFRLNF